MSLDNFFSLTTSHLVDKGDTEASDQLYYGTNNEFTTDFAGPATSNYHGRLSGLVSLWVDTWGDINVTPGDIVEVLFAQGLKAGGLYEYQYSGLYQVRKVVHSIGDTFTTKLLLARNGIETEQTNTLVKAVKKRIAR